MLGGSSSPIRSATGSPALVRNSTSSFLYISAWLYCAATAKLSTLNYTLFRGPVFWIAFAQPFRICCRPAFFLIYAEGQWINTLLPAQPGPATLLSLASASLCVSTADQKYILLLLQRGVAGNIQELKITKSTVFWRRSWFSCLRIFTWPCSSSSSILNLLISCSGSVICKSHHCDQCTRLPISVSFYLCFSEQVYLPFGASSLVYCSSRLSA